MMYFDLMRNSLNYPGMEFDRPKYDKFILYMKLLQEWNQKLNLTAITADDDVITKHFIDSLKAFEFEPLRTAKTVIDVGTGAGFPGVPIRIMRDDVELTLLDSLNKRLNYLRMLCSELKLDNVEFVHARAEDGARKPELRDTFDIAVSRAVANMTVLTELCLPYVRVGGYFVALKGPNIETELSDAKNAIRELGGKLKEVIEVTIESTDLKHNLVIIEKVRETPAKYPRAAGVVAKSPIK